jgi:NADH:ubiquinone oxidoreductase subunit B-like Fe-S oxidoreductase
MRSRRWFNRARSLRDGRLADGTRPGRSAAPLLPQARVWPLSWDIDNASWEIHALNNAFYDLERFGLRFVASPRHADVLLVTGPVTKNMREGLLRTYDATPDPKWVVAVGDCAVDGGIFALAALLVGVFGSALLASI